MRSRTSSEASSVPLPRRGMAHDYMGQQDKFFLIATAVTALVGAGLLVGAFILRFGNNFNGFLVTAKQDNDLLQLDRLDMIFGLYCGAMGILILSFLVAAFATYRKNKFFLYAYCGIIALMIIVQLVDGLLAFQYSDSVKQLSNNENMQYSFNQFMLNVQTVNGKPVPGTDPESAFWTNTQKLFNCCGVNSVKDYKGVGYDYTNNQAFLGSANCFKTHYNIGCESQIRDRITSDSEYFAVSSMGVVVVEIVASFLAGYRAYNIRYD